LPSAGWRESAPARSEQKYENHHSLDTGRILRRHLAHRALCVGPFATLRLVASGVLCLSPDVLFLRRERDDSDAPPVEISAGPFDCTGVRESELNNDAAWLPALFTVAARTVGGQAQRFETLPANMEEKICSNNRE
jgi:hypothetical protein